MANIKKRAIAGAVASVIAATAVVVPWTTRGDTPLGVSNEDITVTSSAGLPEYIPAGDTLAYSFVESLSEGMDPNNSPFGAEHGINLGFDTTYGYNIPWVTKDFPTSADEQLPVEYVYYETTIGDSDDAIPMYCIDFNAKSPSFFTSADGYGSYELRLHKEQFQKKNGKAMSRPDYKDSTLMLAPMLYGYPAFSDRYVDLTPGESRWATSAAFKFISGAVYNADYTSRQSGLKYPDFYDPSFLSGISKQLNNIDPSTGDLTSSSWNALLTYIDSSIDSSAGFGDSSDSFGIEYSPSISGYAPDTDHAGQVMGAIYVMLAGAADIKADDGNFERTIWLNEVFNPVVSGETSRLGPYSFNIEQGTRYSSSYEDSLTDFLLKDDILVNIVGNPSEVYIGDVDGKQYPKSGNSYIIPTDSNFYIFTTATDDVTYNFTAAAKSVKNFENAYYQSEGDVPTQRMLMYAPMDLKGEFSVSFTKSTGTLRILKVDADDNKTPIGNVSFDIYNNENCTGTPVKRITTASDGTASCTVDYGTYYLKEVSAPEHYLQITTPIEVAVSAETEAAGTVKTITNIPLGSLKVIKKDAVSSETLSGAKFTLTSASSIIYNGANVAAGVPIGGEKTTGPDGSVLWDNLPYGTYSLTETAAPDGYLLNSTPISITISGANDSARYVTRDVTNTPLGSLTITKKDSSTGSVLSGAKFKLTSASSISYNGTTVAAGTAIGGERTTDSNGKISWNNLPYGTYSLAETVAPDGYLLNSTPISIVVSGQSNNTRFVSRDIDNSPLGSLTVVKKDSATGTVLQGAKFTLTSSNSITYKGVAIAAGAAIGGEKTTGTDGVVSWDSLPFGTYSLKETSAPDGYIASSAPMSVTISSSAETKHVRKEVTNTPLGSLHVIKKDSETGSTLAGAKFTLTSSKDITYNGITITAGSAIGGEKTTGSNGEITWSNLPYGTYSLNETVVPDGYVKPVSPISITISGTNAETRYVEREVTNTPLGSLDIVKKDAATGDTLQGAKFTLTSAKAITYNGATVAAGSPIGGEKTVDSNGSISWDNLPYGTYSLVETQAPSGYLLSSTPISVTIAGTSNETRHVHKDVLNAALGSLKVIKEDSITGDTLNGANFNVIATKTVKYNGKTFNKDDVIATLTTANDGYAIITGLEPGQYVIQETKAPHGYVINETPVTVTVGSNDTVIPTATVKNFPLGSLKIVKYDADSKERLAGAEFSLESTEVGDDFIANSSYVFTTDENGEAFVDFLSYGEYSLKEITAPNGYEKSDKVYDVVISPESGETSLNIVLEIPNNAQTGKFKISKTNPSKDKPIYASFELRTTKDTYYNGEFFRASSVILTFSTDVSGYYESPMLPIGTYILFETKTQDEYILPEGSIETIEITADSPVEKVIELVNYEKDRYSTFKLYKKDEDTRASLSGAIFEVKDADGNLIDTITTDNSGMAQSDGLEFGTYYIKEITAPDGYALSDKVYEVTLTGDETEEVSITVYNKKESGQIKIIKVDALDNSKRIENVSFSIYDEDNNLVENVNTNHNGEALSSVLPFGTYHIREVSTPSGYVINNEEIKVVLDSTTIDDREIKTVLVENTPVRGRIKIIKYDENYPDNKLVGAEFDILNSDGRIVESITTNASGEATSSILSPGEYVLIETKAPEGYSLNNAPIYVQLSGDGTEELVLETVSIANQKIVSLKGRIQVVKKDSVTKKPMAKVEFELYAKEDVVENGQTIYKKNQFIQTLTTDKKGIATSELLPFGSYYVIESDVVEGYVENKKTYNFVINSTNYDEVQSKTIYNVPTEVVITKVDVTTSEPLPGATIEIYDEDDKLVYEDVTDENGEITAFYLPAGEYTFVETAAPSGYIINPTVFEFEIFEDGTVKGDDTITDKPIEVIITKRDLTTGAPLAGATITIRDIRGNVVFEEVSGPNGEVKAMHLKPGVYTFTEAAAPDGYTRNPETFEFEIYEDGSVRGDCTITDRPTEVIITKKDLTTGAPLAGATIEIRDANGNVAFKEVSGPNGEVKAMHLKPGIYTFKETAAPSGYTINPETFTFELFEDGTVKGDCTITDRPTEVVITKKDLTTAAPLPGATIQIIDSNGKLAFEGVTDKDGNIRAFKLVPGVYTFKEISAPDGYKLNVEKFTFELFEDGSVVGDHEIFDERIPNIKTGVETEEDNSPPILPLIIASALVIFLAGGAVFKIIKKNKK